MNLLNISDNSGDRIIIFDVDSMVIKHEISVGSKPYPVDQVSEDNVFVTTRGESTIQPVNIKTGKKLKTIELSHNPRSTTKHPNKPIAIVGGANKATTTIIDTRAMSVLFSVGSGRSDSRRDFGGGLACGHSAWDGEDKILHFDRIERRIELFDLSSRDLLDSLNVPTSVHHVESFDGFYFGMCEGNQNSLVPPSVIKFKISNNKIVVEENKFLDVPKMSLGLSGGHHLTVNEKSGVVYVGTADSRMFILDASSLEMLGLIDTGPGCGHVTLCPEVGLGVTTNHTGTHMTVFDISSGRSTGSIPVSTPSGSGKKTQGHTTKWFPENARLVTSAAQDGKILEIDPVTLSITNSCALENSYLIQGCFSSV